MIKLLKSIKHYKSTNMTTIELLEKSLVCDCCQDKKQHFLNYLAESCPQKIKSSDKTKTIKCDICLSQETTSIQCTLCLSRLCSICLLKAQHCAGGCTVIFCMNCLGKECKCCQNEYCKECFNIEKRCNNHCGPCSIKFPKEVVCSECGLTDTLCAQCCYYVKENKIYCGSCKKN